jgi:hypothetical protein
VTLPATIATGDVWPDTKNAVVGPFTSGGALYVILVDKTANKLRCYSSTDDGHTWAEVDSANAPACSTTALYKSADVVQSGTTLYAIQPLSVSSMNSRPFDCSANTWSTAIAGPTITINTSQPAVLKPAFVPFAGVRRSDGSFVFAYQGAVESVMGTSYERIKIHIRSAAGTWTGPFDIIGSANSPLANTLPGTQVNYVFRELLLGVSDRVLLFFTNGSTSGLQVRVLLSGNTFAAAITSPTGAVTSHGAVYNVGQATTYIDGALTKAAVPFLSTSGGEWVSVTRCDTATAETGTNWATENTDIPSPEKYASNLAMLNADGKKLWLWYADGVTRWLKYAQNSASTVWTSAPTWKSGSDMLISGFCSRPLTSGLGVAYYNVLGAPTVTQIVADDEHRIAYSDTNGESRGFQKIRFASAVTLRYVRILVRRIGSPPPIMALRVYADSAGVPNQASPVGDETLWQGFDVPTYDTWLWFAPNASLSANTDYWIRVSPFSNVNDVLDHYALRISSSDVYADGAFGTGTSTGTFTSVPGKDMTMMLYASANADRVEYDRLDIYAAKGSLGVGSTSTIIDLGETPPPYYEVIVDLGDNADPAGEVTIYVDGGWDGNAFTSISTDGPNAVQAVNSITVNSPPRYLKVTSVVETSASVIGVAGI